MSYSPQEIAQAIEALKYLEAQKGGNTGYKHDLVPAAGVSPYIHGQGGLFSTPGADPSVFSTIQLPETILNALPVMPPNSSMVGDGYGGEDLPLYDTITGVTAGNLDSWANQPNAPCDDPPTPGLIKLCTLSAPYGRFFGRINPVDISRVARLTNRGEPTDLRLVNSPLNQGGFLRSDLFDGVMGDNVMLSELNVRLVEGATSFVREIAPLAYSGSPANNKAGGGAKQFMGLDLLINTGNKVDVISSAVCTALNSDIKDFNGTLITAKTADGKTIVDYIDAAYAFVKNIAIETQLDPVEWALVVRGQAFFELTKVWPILYYVEALNQIGLFNNGRVNIDARDAVAARDDMRRRRVLPIQGDEVRVIFDNSIPEENNTNTAGVPAGMYQSDFYFVPLTVRGGIPVTYLEAFRYNAQKIREFLNFAGIEPEAYTTSDDGRFLFWRHRTNLCVDIRWLTELRIIMRTPQLAARIQNVRYAPVQHWRDWQPDSSYFTNGGVTSRPTSGMYMPWSPSTPVTIS